MNYEGVAHLRFIVLVQGDTLTYGSDDLIDYFAEPLSGMGAHQQSSIVGLQQVSKFELAPEYLQYPFHVSQGRMSLAKHKAIDFLD